jgi:endonuclease V-like protein UPF0215 family
MGVYRLRRTLAKAHVRVAAVDDGAFTRRQSVAPLVAVAWSSPDQVEGLVLGSVTVDGTDGTPRVEELVRRLPQFEGVRVLLLDGVVVGGFNILDLGRLSRHLHLPVIAVTRSPPDFPKIRAALRKYFRRDAARRWRRLTERPLFPVPTGGRPILAACAGCPRTEAVALLKRVTRSGHWPEPLRLAHLVGHAVGTPDRPFRRRRKRTLKPPAFVRRSGL